MASKTLQRQKKENARRVASTERDWTTLAQKALRAALEAGDKRAQGIEASIKQGLEKKTLRVMNIICENDIAREFKR